MSADFEKLRHFATVVLAAMVGGLISLPISIGGNTTQSLLLPITIIFGGLMGYRKRHNRFFFYFCLVAVAVLATLLMKVMTVSTFTPS